MSAKSWEVNVILATDVEPNGCTAVNPIWTHREPIRTAVLVLVKRTE